MQSHLAYRSDRRAPTQHGLVEPRRPCRARYFPAEFVPDCRLVERNAMSSAEKYRELTARLLDNETWGSLTPAQADALRDAMDELWWQMSAQEQAQQDAWLKQKRLQAPISLGLEDLPLSAENTQGYRKPTD